MTETFRPVAGFEGRYEVSDAGNVRSLITGRILKPGSPGGKGHRTVCLGRGNTRYVHDLVAGAFIGPKPTGFLTRHRDDNPAHNEATNLIYGTRSENEHDKKYNRRSKGHILTVDQVTQLKTRLRLARRGDQVRLATEYGVAPSTISEIKRGNLHADVA